MKDRPSRSAGPKCRGGPGAGQAAPGPGLIGSGDTESARQEAECLSAQREVDHRYLAQLWHALGDQAQARHHALAAYRWAWGQGEPWVFRYELDQAAQLLRELQVPIPDLPPYDPAADPPFPWEAKVRAAIERLGEERQKKG